MRPQLELIEKIEQYLEGKLSPSDKAAFEVQIASDPALQQEVKLQQDIMHGVERAALRNKVQSARMKYRRGKNFMKWGLGGLGAVIIALSVFYFAQKDSHFWKRSEENAVTVPGEITSQIYRIDASKDTIIETPAGIIMAIPANGFVDDDGKPVDGTIELSIREALDPASIMKAGLSTMSGDQLLETGGMFQLAAKKDEEELKFDPSKSIHVEIPTDTIRPGMQLYKGQRKPDGTIDWIDPKSLARDLVAVDINQLNFYPPLYLDSLQNWGHDSHNKIFTDSLYFSFARLFMKRPTSDSIGIFETSYEYWPADTISRLSRRDSIKKSVPVDIQQDENSHCGINPAKIKSIWNGQFQNTLLSTREFEERIYFIHTSQLAEILDLYVNNLDKNLWEIDSMAANLFIGERSNDNLQRVFSNFAARRDGKVKNGSIQYQKLNQYYQQKTKAFSEAIAKTQAEFWNKQSVLDAEAWQKRYRHNEDSMQRMAQNFSEEFTMNLKEAYRQLGYPTIAPRTSIRPVYTAEINATGWWNVDKAVLESTLTRTSLNYTDSSTGKKAVIRYEPVSFQVENAKDYDRLCVYLLPDKLSSFMKLTELNGEFTGKLNDLMGHTMVAIGYKGGQAYFFSQGEIRPGKYPSMGLNAITNDELDKQLNRLGNNNQPRDLIKERDFLRFEIKDEKRQLRNKELQQLTEKTIQLIFPCIQHPVTLASPSLAKADSVSAK
jgi:hypothetical protein